VVIAIALSVADELAFGVDRKFGCNAISHSSQTDAITTFRFSRKAITFSSYSAQVKAIASPIRTNAITFFRFSHKEIAFPSHSAQVELIANPSQSNTIALMMREKQRSPA
jgi:hypothetical protein